MKFLFQCESESFRFRQTAIASRFIIVAVILFLQFSESAFSQQLQIKREVSFGTPNRDFGNHRVLISSNGDVLTLSEHQLDSSSTRQWLVTRFNKQLVQLGRAVTTLNAGSLDVTAFTQSADKRIVIVGSADLPPVYGYSNYDVRIDKLTETGGFRWEKNIGGNGSDKAVGVQPTSDGGFLVLANSFSTDLDIQNTTGKSQIWLAKLDSNGNKLWGKLLTNTHAHQAADFKKTIDGNFALCGNVTDDVPFGVNNGTGDALIMKFKEDGTIIWQSYIGGNSPEDRFERMVMDANGNILVAGYTKSNQGSWSGNKGDADGWIAKINEQGSAFFNKLIGGSGEDQLRAISISPTGMIIVGGSTTSNDGDMTDNANRHTIWVSTLSSDGSSVTQGYFGHSINNKSSIEDIATAPDGNIYCVANSDDANIFMQNPLGETDGWLINLGEKNTVTATVFIDMNSNGKQDAGENSYTSGKFEITHQSNPGAPEYLFSNKGRFGTTFDTGSYTFRFIPDQPYYTVTPQTKSFTFATYNLADSVTVGLIPGPIKNDLVIDVIPGTTARPGFPLTYVLQYKNVGTTNADNAIVTFVKDPRVTFLSASPAPSGIFGDTLSWQVGLLASLDSRKIHISARLKAPPVTANGDTLLSKASIFPDINDETIDNNTRVIREIVTGSYDPNDKIEFHGGLLATSSVTSERLIYLIRFQNTGTDTAFNIFVRDTLHTNLDWSTLEMISASHAFRLDQKNGSELEWTFSDIRLPDSIVNEKASHGYILYSIKPKTSLVPDDVITNRAGIYFDFNLPIATNITSTKVTDLVLPLPNPVLKGLQNAYCGTAGSQTLQITNVSSAGQATVTVKMNNNLITVDKNGNFTIQPAALASGLQTITISFASNTSSASTTAQFNITTSVTPAVKLSSNVATVSNGTTAIIFSATAASGGGTVPLYTFSADRNFSSILQREGTSNSLAIVSQILNNGDNWFYVKMKTSENCFTSLTAVDSFKVFRASVTSIVDVDFPATIIAAFPNPFRSDITINGLQSSAQYTLQLVNINGKVIDNREVENRTSFTFHNINVSKGQYFIRLYDKKKKRLIGMIPVLHL